MLLLSIVGVMIGIAFVLFGLRRRLVSTAAEPQWIESFSIAQYRPMERLLGEGDYEFLKTQPGFHPSIARQLRKERRKIFAAYLQNLVRDFYRLHHAAVHAALSSAVDNPELAQTLVRQKFLFQSAVVMLRLQLALHIVGIGSIDVRSLVDALGGLSQQTRSLMFGNDPNA